MTLLLVNLIGKTQILAHVVAKEKFITILKRHLHYQTGMRQLVITYVNQNPMLNVKQSILNSFGDKKLAIAVVTQLKQMLNAQPITNLALTGSLTNADVQ